ncbi:death-associated protein kinase 2-like, partial [Hypanus sabinus]|uniref:death-associated protein kinase 2-like n=1 Tax=Hypanus sabinus TaxID=79690 RepID=UPI0028C50105
VKIKQCFDFLNIYLLGSEPIDGSPALASVRQSEMQCTGCTPAGALNVQGSCVTGGELFDYVAEKESLREEEAMDFIVQLLQAVGYLHTNHILHLDLKPENILLRDQGTDRPHIKVIDFGLAQKVQPGAEIRSLGGTPQYIAPEVVNFEPLGPPADMWSIGVITYILLSGFSPFQGDTDNETLTNIVELNYDMDDGSFGSTSDMAKDFIAQLLLKEPGARLTAELCVRHPWIKVSLQPVPLHAPPP